MQSKTFCILPWIRVQLRHTGDVYPCCRISHSFSYGRLDQNSLSQIWNSDVIKQVRLDMLRGKSLSFCSDCYWHEDHGNESERLRVNKLFAHHFERLNQTNADGHLNIEQIPSLDIRFSNTCNFKCRMCDSDSSTSWREDEKRLDSDLKPIGVKGQSLKIEKFNSESMSELYAMLSSVESIYFAGGEPLLEKEHYLLLERLINLNKTDLELSYNSNLSMLHFSKWHVLQLWNKFRNVHLAASIDAVDERASIIRNGSKWLEIESNINQIRVFAPHVQMSIFTTVSVQNCFHLPELVKYFIDKNIVRNPEHIEFNTLIHPDFLNVSILNENETDKLEVKYLNFLKSLKDLKNKNLKEHLEKSFNSILMSAKKSPKDILTSREKLVRYTKQLDNLRNENSNYLFSELELD